MRIDNDRLVGNDNRKVQFKKAGTSGGGLTGGKPRFLVIHYTANGSAGGAVNWFTRSDANTSAHLVIGHDGAITQLLNFDTVGWHAGKSEWKNVKGLNSHSVGIEVVNWGILSKSSAGSWVSWTGTPIPDQRVILASHRHRPGQSDGWEVFDEVQFMATVDAARAIVEEYGIGPSDVVGHDDISPGRKVDPGPAFDMDRFRALVFGRSEDDWNDLAYKVRSNSGLNLRKGPSVDHEVIKLLDDGAEVHAIEQTGKWWLVAEVVSGKEDQTGYVHSHWLRPA